MQNRIFLLCACALIGAATNAQEIERVEPPSWWTGFEHSDLQLMLHGNGIAELTPEMAYAGIAIDRVVRTSSPNYLFVYVNIDHAVEPGRFDIVLRDDNEVLTHAFELRPRSPDLAVANGFNSADVIYLITPDRFANGDPGNDEIEQLEDKPDRDEPFGRHGGDLQGIHDHLDYIADMGFTAVWLNPVLENAMPEASYHGYATTDYYKVDPRFGTNEQYRLLVAAMREHGIGMIMDMIANHIGTGHWWMDDLPARDWLNHQGGFVPTTHARTANQDPYASEYDKAGMADGWFVPSMPDLNQRNPLLADYLIQNAIWWIEYAGLSGIRMDTWPYPDKAFLAEWARRILVEYPHFSIVGEEWSESPAVTSYWQRGKQNHDGYVSWLPSVFDFPVQAAMKRALTSELPPWGSIWNELYETVGVDYLYPEPMDLVIFPDNHDMDRVYTQLGEDYDLYRMALVYYLTMRGIPQIYYGTEILASHTGTSSHGVLRSDFPGGWAGDRKNAFTARGLTDSEREAQRLMRDLLNWRKDSKTIHTGKFMHYTPVGQVYVYFRYDEDDTVMVVMNRDDKSVTIDTSRFDERIGERTHAIDVISGKRYRVERELVLEPRSVLLLELD